jgi:hypothetical protein
VAVQRRRDEGAELVQPHRRRHDDAAMNEMRSETANCSNGPKA